MACARCGDLPAIARQTTTPSGVENPFPPALERLEQYKNLYRCWECGTVFRKETEWDQDHFYGNSYETLRRLSPDEELEELAAGGPEWWRAAMGYEERIAALAQAIRDDHSADPVALARMARTLALHHARLGAWREVVAFLASDVPAIRRVALSAVETFSPPPSLMPIIAALGGEQQEAVCAILSSASPEAFAEALPVLVDRLSSEDPGVRDLVVDLIEQRHEHGELGRAINASVRQLLARLSAILRHCYLGLSAPAGGARPNRTTSQVAAWIFLALGELQALAPDVVERLAVEAGDDDEVVARKAEEQIDAAVAHLPYRPHGHVASHDLDPARIPIGTRDLHQLSELAMSFHAYSVLGSTAAAMQFGNAARRRFRRQGKIPFTPTGIRIALFMECRRRVHTAEDMTEEDWRYTDALLSALREVLSS